MPSQWLQVLKSDYGTMITNHVTIGCLYVWKLQHGVALVEVSDSSVDCVSVVAIVSGVTNSFTRALREILALTLLLVAPVLTCSAHFSHVGSLLFSGGIKSVR